MTEQDTKQTILDQWSRAGGGGEDVTLPSGTRVRLQLPAVDALVRAGALPQALQAIAVRFTTERFEPDKLSPDELMALLGLAADLVARSLRAVWDTAAGAWQPIRLTVQELDAADLGAPDLDAMRAVVFREATAAQITARAQAATGAIDQAQAAAVEDEEAGSTVDGWLDFPGDGAGVDAGAPGEMVGPTPIADAPGRRSRGRARAG